MDRIDYYKHIRNVGRIVSLRIFQMPAFKGAHLIEAAKKLQLYRNKTFILDRRFGMDVIMDFALYDLEKDGKSFIELIAPQANQLSAEENKVFNAMQDAYASLFDVVDIDKANKTIKLKDVLAEDGKEYIVTDIGLSQTLQRTKAIYTRLLTYPECTLTTGVVFGFNKLHIEKLVSALRFLEFKKGRGLSAEEEFVFFYQQVKLIGQSAERIDLSPKVVQGKPPKKS